MNAKQRAVEIYGHHIALATTDGRLFRKTVMDQLMSETGCSLAAAATHYNNAKKGAAPIEGLGRAPVPKGMRKMGNAKSKNAEDLIPDEDCFTVIELLQNEGGETVGRCQSFILQGDASEKFDAKSEFWPNSVWVLIQGLGPNTGDTFKLDAGEKEIKRYAPAKKVVEEAVPA
jgi:hypothetical protein